MLKQKQFEKFWCHRHTEIKFKMRLDFSCNTGYLWKERPFLERLKIAKSHKFSSLEFHDEPHNEDLLELKDLLDELELPINGMNAVMGDTFGCAAISSRTKVARKEVEEAIAIADKISSPALHILSGIAENNSENLQAYLNNLRYALDNSDITILIEPVCSEQLPGYFLRTISQAAEVTKEIDHPRLKIMFDCYHIYRESGDLIQNFSAHAKNIGHVQIAAIEGRAEPFSGELDYSLVLPKLKALGYDGAFGCEYRPKSKTEDGLSWRDQFEWDN